MTIPTHWTMVHEYRYVRTDGAVVMWDQRSPHPNPLDPNARMWTAWEPDPSDRAVCKTHYHSQFLSPRRWKTLEAAMEAVDRLFPIGTWEVVDVTPTSFTLSAKRTT